MKCEGVLRGGEGSVSVCGGEGDWSVRVYEG